MRKRLRRSEVQVVVFGWGWEENWVTLVFSGFRRHSGAAVEWTRASCRLQCSSGKRGGWGKTGKPENRKTAKTKNRGQYQITPFPRVPELWPMASAVIGHEAGTPHAQKAGALVIDERIEVHLAVAVCA